MSADSANDFFWQAMSSSDSNGDLQLQRTAFDNFVSQGNEDSSQMQLHIQSESSPSPTSIIATSGENANNNNRLSTSSSPTSQQALYTTVNSDAGSPTNTQQGLLPYGVINPDAIIPQSRSYTCRICQVTFPNKSAVTVHSRIHTDHEGKPYRCSFCGKGFSTNFYLKQHERIHNGQKPYKCPMCEHSFKQLSHVQQHVRTHTGVRPYKCHWPDCGKAFLQQSHLKSHVERHSPNLKAHVARHAPKTQKRKSSNDTKIQQEPEIPVVENQVHKENIEDNMDPGCFSLVSMPPDVIGQAAAAANIVPVPVHYESICPFLCPGCSKLYVREATFKKHLEECKTKLQLSISATAAALGIDPPHCPHPIPNHRQASSQILKLLLMPMDVNLNNEAAPPRS
uniref:zinc finger protein 420-like isoform X2 n=1 Tax=Styela clava TaxID=7725 RepID=UPI00193AB464|nr:zinc finger protein 420-like isoform X2 [Styela clava]